ncbi:MAG: hypothetical protein GWM98_03345 [Nitrospinaceae bacterium]|nr:hypothetical protein [Nitrospinaceae bacterium]NIR53724.1 hypothetical protein [Nitrospinaceae bacterium]NIS84132.1 hypothetical protein [Nitrospinaceae bacterium]NIT80933.1 hypothetical protein [Nitrospinaceae bacterium]NIU43231.1 hypothetical protein [Nitrospinaceae bacterium]
MNKHSLYTLAGTLWGLVGLFLVVRGAFMYQDALTLQSASQTALMISIAASLVLGTFKGRFVLSKTARRNKARIEAISEPLKFHHIYTKSFYFLIAGMILLGVSLRTWNEYLGGYVVVAAIYCGIGLALIVSSRVYWKTESPPAAEKTS